MLPPKLRKETTVLLFSKIAIDMNLIQNVSVIIKNLFLGHKQVNSKQSIGDIPETALLQTMAVTNIQVYFCNFLIILGILPFPTIFHNFEYYSIIKCSTLKENTKFCKICAENFTIIPKHFAH